MPNKLLGISANYRTHIEENRHHNNQKKRVLAHKVIFIA